MDTKICSICGLEKPLEEFVKNKTKKSGYASHCKNCHKIICHNYYIKNQDIIRLKKNKYKEYIKKYILEKKSNGCYICGEKDPICLDFHHLKNKEYNISDLIKSQCLNKIKTELKKCIVLCANCHRKVHYYNLNVAV